jgi:2-dehydro-3-deoxyphosphogluconate aldolase/(4S)-4-hydroxy-2-oxoglutarate aldolase
MVELSLVPVFYQADVKVAKKIGSAYRAGGANLVEFANRGDFAPQVFRELTQHFAQADSRIILGVGSVIDAPTAALYIAYGANFVVGPSLNPEIARWWGGCHRGEHKGLVRCGRSLCRYGFKADYQRSGGGM